MAKLSCRIWAPLLDSASLRPVQSAILVFARFLAPALPASNVTSRLFMYSRSLHKFRGAVFAAKGTAGPSCGYTLLLWGVADRKICSGRDCRSSPNERDVRVATGRKTFPQRKDREYRCSNDQVRMYFSSSATVAWICALHLWTNSLRSKLRLAIFRISCGYTQSNKNVAL